MAVGRSDTVGFADGLAGASTGDNERGGRVLESGGTGPAPHDERGARHDGRQAEELP